MSTRQKAILWVLWILAVALVAVTLFSVISYGELNALALGACIVSIVIVSMLTMAFRRS